MESPKAFLYLLRNFKLGEFMSIILEFLKTNQSAILTGLIIGITVSAISGICNVFKTVLLNTSDLWQQLLKICNDEKKHEKLKKNKWLILRDSLNEADKSIIKYRYGYIWFTNLYIHLNCIKEIPFLKLVLWLEKHHLSKSYFLYKLSNCRCEIAEYECLKYQLNKKFGEDFIEESIGYSLLKIFLGMKDFPNIKRKRKR